MRFRFTVGLGAAIALCLIASPGAARADACSDLWFGRNQIYKAAGYCFRTSRAIAAFGNAGCQYDALEDVPLSARDRAAVARYVREEAALGCGP